jgi:two-component system response regulator MprA
MPSVLIVDDDQRLLKMLQRTMTYEGLKVLSATNGQDALDLIDLNKPDIIILDWMMPKMDGLAVVRQLRSENNQTYILMLTARDAVENRVQGLESGADDYLVKPFAPEELVARVHAFLRRIDANIEPAPLSYENLTLDTRLHEVRLDGSLLELTPTEFELLHYMMRHPRIVLARSKILNSVWGYDFSGDDNVLEVYVGYLRKKLEANGHRRIIHTVRGIGYVLRGE